MDKNTIPVTLNCSGGIALGAYMAGVFSELVTACLRTGADQTEPLICIDTITGASAGAMTGLIAARCLLQDPEVSLRELAEDGGLQSSPTRERQAANRFYQAWVKLADIRKLLDYQAEEHQLRRAEDPALQPRVRLGLLSGEAIASIAESVAGEWSENDLEGMTKALKKRSLALLMTTTNLQGVLRSSECNILSVSHAETRRFLFHRSMSGLQAKALPDLNARWTKAKESARESGAFPAAFPPISDSSNPDSPNIALDPTSRKLYDKAAQDAAKSGADSDPDSVCRFINQSQDADDINNQLRLRFDYTDGGVLDGLPILKGIELLEKINKITTGESAPDTCDDAPPRTDNELDLFCREWHATAPREEQRQFVYVKPIPVTDLSSSPSLLRRFFGLFATGMAGLTYPKAEHDHLRLEEIRRINDIVKRRDALIKQVDRDPEQAERLRKVLPFRHVTLAAIDPVLTFRLAPFRDVLLEEMARVTGGVAPVKPVKTEAEALACFEQLLGKRADPPETLTELLSASDLLATDFLGAFGGFFQERYRRHDYLIGRLSGLAWLHSLDPAGHDALIRSTLGLVLRRAPEDYLPLEERSGLRFPSDWLRLLRLATVRLPYVLLNDALAGGQRRRQPLRAWQRSLLRVVIAPLVGILTLMVVPPALAIIVALLLAVGWLFGL